MIKRSGFFSTTLAASTFVLHRVLKPVVSIIYSGSMHAMSTPYLSKIGVNTHLG